MRKRIVILGAGFAGLQLARRIKESNFEITLIDQYNFHQFQPLLFQVATGRLEPSAVSFPLRKVFQGKKNIHVRIAKTENIDTVNQIVVTSQGNFSYDFLVVATGCTSNYFGNANFEKFAFPMKSTNEAIVLRNRVLLNFEDALSAPVQELEEIMTITIAGGGPTGVELAGALAELKKNILPRDYPDMDFSMLNIYLIEGMPHTLQNMSTSAQNSSQSYLEKMGVKVMLNTRVVDYDGTTLQLSDGTSVKTRTMIWTAGVMGNVPEGIPRTAIARGNRISVNSINLVKGMTNVFAIGDVCCMENSDFPNGHPQLANVAINQAKNLAKNILLISHDAQPLAFKYKNPGTMATVGKHNAVVDLPFFSFNGRLAWLTWMFLHLMLILSVKNKLLIFINWAISYFTNDTTLRLILQPTHKPVDNPSE